MPLCFSLPWANPHSGKSTGPVLTTCMHRNTSSTDSADGNRCGSGHGSGNGNAIHEGIWDVGNRDPAGATGQRVHTQSPGWSRTAAIQPSKSRLCGLSLHRINPSIKNMSLTAARACRYIWLPSEAVLGLFPLPKRLSFAHPCPPIPRTRTLAIHVLNQQSNVASRLVLSYDPGKPGETNLLEKIRMQASQPALPPCDRKNSLAIQDAAARDRPKPVDCA